MTHPALRVLNDLYDATNEEGDRRDYEPHEQAFSDAIKAVRDRKTDAYKRANTAPFNEVPKLYRARLIHADEIERKELDAALSAYERDVEAQDELEEVAYAMAEAAE